MKRSLSFLFYALLLSLACKGEGISTKIVLTNPGQTDRQDEAFVLTRDGLPPSPDDTLLPALRQAGGDYVPAQADDLDGDGQWDELAFVYSLRAGETATLRDVYGDRRDPEGPVPALGAAVACIAAMQSVEAVKLLAGMPSEARGKLITVDMGGWSVESARIS